jgi:hypothetical protein
MCIFLTLITQEAQPADVAIALSALAASQVVIFALCGVTNWVDFFVKVGSVANQVIPKLLGNASVEQAANAQLIATLQPHELTPELVTSINTLIKQYQTADGQTPNVELTIKVYGAHQPQQRMIQTSINEMEFTSEESKSLAYTLLDKSTQPKAFNAMAASSDTLFVDTDIAQQLSPEELEMECHYFYNRMKDQIWLKQFALSCAQKVGLVQHKAAMKFRLAALKVYTLMTAEAVHCHAQSIAYLTALQEYYTQLSESVKDKVLALNCPALSNIYSDLKKKAKLYHKDIIPTLQALYLKSLATGTAHHPLRSYAQQTLQLLRHVEIKK